MSQVDQEEVRELRLRVQGAEADRVVIEERLRDALEQNRALENQLAQVTAHRNRLIAEREETWRHVLDAPDPDVPASGELPPLGGGDDQC